jgi:hypothetical protein
VAEDVVDGVRPDAESSSRDVPEIMRFAELYPSVALQTVVSEVVHAQDAVPSNAADRNDVIAGIVAARLQNSGA